jgi:hypothetical protein
MDFTPIKIMFCSVPLAVALPTVQRVRCSTRHSGGLKLKRFYRSSLSWKLHQARHQCVKNGKTSGQGLNWVGDYVTKIDQ